MRWQSWGSEIEVVFPDLACLPEITSDKLLLCNISSICKMQMIMVMSLLGTVTLSQPVRQAVVLRWLALEKQEGHARTALGGRRCFVSQANTPQAAQLCPCTFAPRKAHAAHRTGLMVPYTMASLSQTSDSQLTAEEAAMVPSP